MLNPFVVPDERLCTPANRVLLGWMKLEIHYKGSMTEGILAPPRGHFVIMMCSLSKYIIWTDYMKNLGHLRNTKAATG